MGFSVSILLKYLTRFVSKVRELLHGDCCNAPVHRHLHPLLVMWHWAMDLVQWLAHLSRRVPSYRRAHHASAHMVQPRLLILQRKREVLRNVVEQHAQCVRTLHALDAHLLPEDVVLEEEGVGIEREAVGIADGQPLGDHLEQLRACELGAGEGAEDQGPMGGVECLSLGDGHVVSRFERRPPVRLHLLQS